MIHMQVVIYLQDNGVPAVLVPTQEALLSRTVYEIAVKDVPSGKRFKIVNASSLPQNIPQEAWVVNENDLNDGIGGGS